MSSHRGLLWLVALSSAALYAANLWDPLLADDFDLIRSFYEKPPSYLLALLWSNESGDVWAHFGIDPAEGYGYLRPVKIWLLALDQALWGAHPLGYHLTSTAAYVAVVVATAALLRESLPGRPLLAAAGALTIAIHPVFAEIVPFVTAREETLSAAFVLAGLLAFVRARDGRGSPAVFAALLAAGLAVKESAVCLVALAACHDLAHGRLRPDRDRVADTVRVWRPALGVLAVYLALRWMAFGNLLGGGGQEADYLSWRALRFFPRVLESLVDPTLLSIGTSPSAQWAIAVTIAVALVALAAAWPQVAAQRRRELLFFGPFWFVATTALYAGIPFATRHHALPVIGLGLFGTLLVASLLDAGILRRERRVAFAGLATAACLFLPSSCTTSREYVVASRAVERIRAGVEQRTADLPDGSVVLLRHVPQWTVPPYYFGWSLLSGLREPFTPSDVAGRLEVVNARYRELNGVDAPPPPAFDRLVRTRYVAPTWIRLRRQQRLLRDFGGPWAARRAGASPPLWLEPRATAEPVPYDERRRLE